MGQIEQEGLAAMGRRKSSRKNNPVSKAAPSNQIPADSPASLPLHQEDAELWAQVTKSLTPLKGAQDRMHFGPLLDEKPSMRPLISGEQATRASSSPSARTSSDKKVSIGGFSARQPLEPKIEVSQQNSFSRREMRQINKGHLSIEARLDLHGLRQAGAHVALRSFLIDAQAKGFRHVLVITGKGRSNSSALMVYGEDEAGILRRVVPLWLREPGLREIVTGFSDAPRRHGGEGALYVRLRRNRSHP